jgi:hypothetical protein
MRGGFMNENFFNEHAGQKVWLAMKNGDHFVGKIHPEYPNGHEYMLGDVSGMVLIPYNDGEGLHLIVIDTDEISAVGLYRDVFEEN